MPHWGCMALVRSHDGLFRFVFGEPEQMAELLRSQLPSAMAAAIRWSTLRRIEGSFVDEALRGRITDLLFEVDLHGAPLLLHTVVDHKSGDDWGTALQMARYGVRIHDRWLADHPGARSLPPILAFVVHHGDRPWRAARSADDLVDLSGCADEVASFLLPLQLRMPFLLLNLAAMDEAAVDGLRLSIVSSLTLRFLQFLRRLQPEAAVEHIVRWQRLVVRLLEHRRGKDVLTALFSWFLAGAPDSHRTLRTVMARIDEENVPMRSALDLVLDMGHERGMQKGLQQGLQQGLEALRQMLAEQLRTRFSELTAAHAARLAAADLATLQAWGERLLRVDRIGQVFDASPKVSAKVRGRRRSPRDG